MARSDELIFLEGDQESLPRGDGHIQDVDLMNDSKLRILIRQIHPGRQTSNKLTDSVRDLSDAACCVKVAFQLSRISVVDSLSSRYTQS